MLAVVRTLSASQTVEVFFGFPGPACVHQFNLFTYHSKPHELPEIAMIVQSVRKASLAYRLRPVSSQVFDKAFPLNDITISWTASLIYLSHSRLESLGHSPLRNLMKG